MMAYLFDGDIDIDGYVFGAGHDIFITELDTEGVDLIEQDADNVLAETRAFGRDYLKPATWTLSVVTNGRTAAEGLAQLAEAQAVFRNADVRLNPGALSVLRYSVAGRARRIYGRPRRLKRKPGPVNDGAIEAVGMFDAYDTLYYDDDARSVHVDMVPAPTGGFTFPTTFPIIMAGMAEQQGIIPDVGGTEPTPFTAVIHGPITNPGLAGDDWEIKLNTSLAEGVDITVDTRLGTVVDSLGISRAGSLTRRSRLKNGRLKPGSDRVIFSGSDPTGQASADVIWHPAYGEL